MTVSTKMLLFGDARVCVSLAASGNAAIQNIEKSRTIFILFYVFQGDK
jgi:hypothetical protein